MKRAYQILISILLLSFLGAGSAYAQGSDELLPLGDGIGQSEPESGELEEFDSTLNEPSASPESSLPPTSSPSPPPPPVNIESLSDLSRLVPFSDVSVLQKRFLPKTQRFQLSGGFTMITNDPWYWGLGANARFAYYLREAWGLEFSGEIFSHSERDQVKDLRANNTLSTDSFVFIKDYLGVDILWNPMYGKMSLRNLRIIPFDLYFAFGGGLIGTGNAKEKTSTAMHLGTGQIFAISKSTAFRWSFDWKYFNATPSSLDPARTLPTNNFSYFSLSVGVSYFFPEANYR
jgi:outer membrane beta-barrel protein